MDINSSYGITHGMQSLSTFTEKEDSGLQVKADSSDGDTVSISSEAYERFTESAKEGMENKETEESTASPAEQLIERLEERIRELEEEIEELQNSNMPEEEKRQMLAEKQSELSQLQAQLMEAQKEAAESEGMSLTGGTRANGFGNSLS